MTSSNQHQIVLTANKRAAFLLMLLPPCLFLWGCKSPLDVSNLNNFRRRDEPITVVDDTRSPLERVMQAVGRGREEAARRNYRPAEGIAAYDDAKALFDQGEHKADEKQFKRIAKKYRDSQIEEDALFMLAESRFEQKRYSWAQDGYDALFEKYPSTRYTNQSTRRMFTIARTWLEFPDLVTSSDIQQVDYSDPQSTPPPKLESPSRFQLTRAVPILPNFLDRTRPVFDTQGRALEALKSIWLNDPTGPLADDSLMLTASYHLRNGDYREAARNYRILREEYPKSQHLQNAFLLGSHVRLMSYQGADYDGKALDEARQLKESSLKLFPGTRDAGRLKDDLRQIDEAKAERDWETVVFYEKKRKPRAVVVYCRQILENYPNTSYAARAREKLDELRVRAAAPSLRERVFGRVQQPPSRPTVPGSPLPGDDFDRGFPAAGEPDIPIITDPEPGIPIITDPEPGIPIITDSETAPASEPGFGQRVLRRLEGFPRLFRTPGGDDAETDDIGRASP